MKTIIAAALVCALIIGGGVGYAVNDRVDPVPILWVEPGGDNPNTYRAIPVTDGRSVNGYWVFGVGFQPCNAKLVSSLADQVTHCEGE